MQEGSVLSFSPSFNLYTPPSGFAEVAKVTEDFGSKMKFDAFGTEFDEPKNEGSSRSEALDEESRDEPAEEGDQNVEEEEVDDEEFSFACTNPDGSPISADDVFVDGQIRPVYPLFNQDLLFTYAYDGDSKPKDASSSPLRPPLRKFFVEERDIPSSSSSEYDELEGAAEGTYCVWSGNAAEALPRDLSKKSNSTGFCKLWRFRDLLMRSNSDGHDAFVFLNQPSGNAKLRNETSTAKKNENVDKNEKGRVSVEKAKPNEKAKTKTKGVKGSGETASSAHERHYVKNRAKREGEKWKSYLPYRQVGFFTNVNGFSRNVHPF
ncbi:uncharacterized protein LOC122311815 [Carya illinoinensis]|uniref:Uncharacterized protein n=1 Tax=Carya illinoinensis TaxID=32201 RepID=A0A8T1QJ33_CARIL|nr:uncharacterized protein LOC122311815 [Carya illinoinensis]KAG6654536.1 hypothetical protein CIPAW_05G151600 [Carya illinoinensis]